MCVQLSVKQMPYLSSVSAGVISPNCRSPNIILPSRDIWINFPESQMSEFGQ